MSYSFVRPQRTCVLILCALAGLYGAGAARGQAAGSSATPEVPDIAATDAPAVAGGKNELPDAPAAVISGGSMAGPTFRAARLP